MSQLLVTKTIDIQDIKEQFHHSPHFLRIWIPGRVVPKLRPRGKGKGRSYNPRNYRLWKNTHSTAITQIKLFNDYEFDLNKVSMSYWDNYPIKGAEVISNFCCGFIGDPDNRHAAILDLLVSAGILEDDRTKLVPEGRYRTFESKTVKGTLVLVKPEAKIMEFDLNMLLNLVP